MSRSTTPKLKLPEAPRIDGRTALFAAIAAYGLSVVADFLSSMGMPENFIEQNPFARHLDGSFYPAHAALNCLVMTLPLIAASYILNKVGKPISPVFGRVLAALPWLPAAYGHADAAAHNTMIHLHLYTPSF